MKTVKIIINNDGAEAKVRGHYYFCGAVKGSRTASVDGVKEMIVEDFNDIKKFKVVRK